MSEYRAPLRPSQVATRLGINKMTVYAMIKSGELRAFRVGNQFRVPAEEIARIENTPAADLNAS